MIAWLTGLFGEIEAKRESSAVEAEKEAISSKVQLAHAVLLLDLALVDNEFGDDEHEFIKHRLCNILKVDLDSAYHLIAKAEELVGEDRNIDAFGKRLQDELGAREREDIVHSLDRLIEVDGSAVSFELKLRERYAQILGVRVRRRD